MVVSRSSDQRQRKKPGETTPPPPAVENGKRTKVHAQRKFAQGASLSSPALTPVKDKHKANGSVVAAEIIPAKRPKTHDFLTFLCLRGTPILPSRLDFFSVSPCDGQNDDDFASPTTSSSVRGSTKSQTSQKSSDKSSEPMSSSGRRNEPYQQNGGLGQRRRSSAPAVSSSTVQALKKKYQDQRMSKQNRSGVLNKLAQRVKDKNMVRTRSSGQVESQKVLSISPPTRAKQTPVKTKLAIRSPVKASELSMQHIDCVPSDSEELRATRSSGPLSPPPTVHASKKKVGVGLRSGARRPSPPPVTSKAKKPSTPAQTKKAAAATHSDSSSDEDEPLVKKVKTQAAKSVETSQKKLANKKETAQALVKTRSKRGEDVSPARKETPKDTSPPKPQARLSRKTKEAAAVYMELLGKTWRDPGEEDDDDDDDSLSLYSFPELHRHSPEKRANENAKKAAPKKKPEKVEPPKKCIDKKSSDKKVVEKKKPKEEDSTIQARQPSASSSGATSNSVSRRSSAASSPQRRSSVTSLPSTPQRRRSTASPPPTQRRSMRGMPPPLEPITSPVRTRDSDSDEEPLLVKMCSPARKSEPPKPAEKKKEKKTGKVQKVKGSSSSIAKRTRLHSEKLKLLKEAKKNDQKNTLNKLLEQTKRKYLSPRKSKEACIQELVQSTLERLNKEAKQEMRRAKELSLKEAQNKPSTSSQDSAVSDKKVKTQSSSEEKVVPKKDSQPAKKDSTSASPKKESTLASKPEPKVRAKSTETKSSVEEPLRLVAKKSASFHPKPAPSKKSSPALCKKPIVTPVVIKAVKKGEEEEVTVIKEVAAPVPEKPMVCSPLMCSKPGPSGVSVACNSCGRGEASSQPAPAESKKEVPPSPPRPLILEQPPSPIKNLNWGGISSFKVQTTQSVQISSTMVSQQQIIAPHLLQPSTSRQEPARLIAPQAIMPHQMIANMDMKKLMSDLAVLRPGTKTDQPVLLLTTPNPGAGTGQYIMCHKEQLAALESSPLRGTGGVHFMVLPTAPAVAPLPVLTASPSKPHSAFSGLKPIKPKKPEIKEPVVAPLEKPEKKRKSASSTQTAVPKSPDEKRPIFQHRREKAALAKRVEAFSPENESSVYAFETDPEDEPTGIPFRRNRSKEDSSSSSSSPPTPSASTHSVGCGTESPPQESAGPSSRQVVPSVSAVTTAIKGSQNKSSASIAVQVNFDEVASTSSESPIEPSAPATAVTSSSTFRSLEISTQTEEEAEDDHLFYIPLQRGTPAPQQLIQGVEVKLGTEGPTGPNQRVIMRAKLVTKPPERFSAALNATGMVRSSQHPTSTLGHTAAAAAAAAGSKTPLVGTVQPTARGTPVPASPPSTSTPRSGATSQTSSPSRSQKSSAQGASPAGQPSVASGSSKKASPATTSKQAKSSPQPSGLKSSPLISSSKPSSEASTSGVSTPGTSSKPTGASTKAAPVPQKVVTKRNSVEAGPSTPKPTKKPPLQRQLSNSGASTSSSPNTAPRVMEAVPTPAKFPSASMPGQLIEAPTFHPTEKDFQDPLEYIERIRPLAEQFGLCRIVPPSTFKPECKVTDDMRFTAYNHYVHKMLDRWGPNVKETTAIKKYLKSQNVDYAHFPWIGGMEIDLPRFYQTVQQQGGLMEVIEKKKWQKVAESMKIPKFAQDRVSKLDEIYCKFLLAYDMLSPEERQQLFDAAEEEWAKKQVGSSEDLHTEDESLECIIRGRNMPLNAFYRIARNTMSMYFRNPEPSPAEVEAEYWRIAQERTSHVCVHAGSIDSGVWGYGFPCKNSPCAKHPWNLKVLSNNSGTVLRSMGSVMGVTVPTLHVGMLFSTCCWYRDPQGLSWIEYLHTGASKIWYGIPDSESPQFRDALRHLVPRYGRDPTVWLPSDTAMVPPSLLTTHGVSVCRTVQEPGQFILVFPRAFTSSVCTGYLVSESVYFAQPSWLATADALFKELKESCEPTAFSLDQLLFSIAQDNRSSIEVLRTLQPKLRRVVRQEQEQREILRSLGLCGPKFMQRLPLPEAAPRRRRQQQQTRHLPVDEYDHECLVCRTNLYLSLVSNSEEGAVYCLPHAIQLLTKKKHHLRFCKLLYLYDEDELQDVLQELDDKIEAKSSKKSQGKHASASK